MASQAWCYLRYWLRHIMSRLLSYLPRINNFSFLNTLHLLRAVALLYALLHSTISLSQVWRLKYSITCRLRHIMNGCLAHWHLPNANKVSISQHTSTIVAGCYFYCHLIMYHLSLYAIWRLKHGVADDVTQCTRILWGAQLHLIINGFFMFSTSAFVMSRCFVTSLHVPPRPVPSIGDLRV
jgi:hypothetical protein